MSEWAVVYERGGSAPIKASLEARGAELSLFSKADTKRIMVAALRTGAQYYLAKYVPQLFTGRIYRAPFNYQISEEYRRRKNKAGENRPLVSYRTDHEHLIEAAQNKAYVTVEASGDRVGMTIHIPWDVGNQNRKVVSILQTLPAEWLEDTARVVAQTIETLLAGGQPSNRGRMALSADVRKRIGSVNARRHIPAHTPRQVP